MSKQEQRPARPNLTFSIENILKEDFPRRSTTSSSQRKAYPLYVLPFERRNVAVPLPVYCGMPYGQYPPFPLYPQPFSRVAGRQSETVNSYQKRTEAGSVSASTTFLLREGKSTASASSHERKVSTPGGFINRGQGQREESAERKEFIVERTSPRRTPTKDAADGRNGTPKKKRIRSHFSQLQLQYLENVFSRQQYLSRDERTLLAGALEMTELQIRNWFQNKRYQKRHRELQAMQTATTKQVPVKVLVSEGEVANARAQSISPALSDLSEPASRRGDQSRI